MEIIEVDIEGKKRGDKIRPRNSTGRVPLF